MEAAVQSLKKGKSAGVDNIPAEQVQQVEKKQSLLSQQSAARSGTQENGQPLGPSIARTIEQSVTSATQESNAEDYTEQIVATSREDHC